MTSAATPSPLTDEADTPLPASALIPDGPSSEEAAPTSTDTAFPIVATASSQVKPEGDQATTELHAPGVRRRFDRLPRRSRLSRGRRQPSRHRHRLRCVRGTTRPPMVFDRPLSESRIQPLHARVRLERRQRLLPRRHHRQDDRRADPSPLGRGFPPRICRRHPRDLYAAVHLQRVDEGVRQMDDPVDNTNRAAE